VSDGGDGLSIAAAANAFALSAGNRRNEGSIELDQIRPRAHNLTHGCLSSWNCVAIADVI